MIPASRKRPPACSTKACGFAHGLRRDRIAVDDQSLPAAGAQRIRRFACETDRDAQIHD
jgi:hypothetical protein